MCVLLDQITDLRKEEAMVAAEEAGLLQLHG